MQPQKKATEPGPGVNPVPAANPNTKLWSAVEHTDPKFTKEFKRGGGFSGTTINPQWLCKRATEQFGPIGKGWGWVIAEERKEANPTGEIVVWLAKLRVWYVLDGQRYETPEQWGATEFIGKNKYGPFVDEEAPKKTITDALTKCLSYLGFAADVHMGLYDDSKYVNDRRQEFGNGQPPAQQPAPQTAPAQNGTVPNGKAAEPGYAAWVRQAEGQIANLNSATDCNEWVIKNTKILDKLKTQSETAYDGLMVRVTERQTRLLAA